MGCDIVTGGVGFGGSHLVDRLAERMFHLAARPDIVPSIQQPEAYFRANVDGTFIMLEAARRQAVQRFIYVASSSSCYRIPNIYPTPETASEYWRGAPVWTVSSIAEATADWHKFLGHVEPRGEG